MGATRAAGLPRAFCIQRERPAAPASTPENAAAGWPDAPPRRASESTVSHELRTRAVRVCIRQPTHKDFDGDAYCIQSQCPCKTPAEIRAPPHTRGAGLRRALLRLVSDQRAASDTRGHAVWHDRGSPTSRPPWSSHPAPMPRAASTRRTFIIAGRSKSGRARAGARMPLRRCCA
jgi:hypothetical protein